MSHVTPWWIGTLQTIKPWTVTWSGTRHVHYAYLWWCAPGSVLNRKVCRYVSHFTSWSLLWLQMTPTEQNGRTCFLDVLAEFYNGRKSWHIIRCDCVSEGPWQIFTGDGVTFITFQTNSYQDHFIWSLQAKLLVVIFDPKQEQINARKQEGIKRLKTREQAENYRGERSRQQCWRAAQRLHMLQKWT